jgi:Domain of unknown function (DUF5666)
MRKILALSMAAVFCLAVAAYAGENMDGKKVEGTVSKLDLAGKMMVVKTADGNETTVYWNDTTKVEGGELKEGQIVHVKALEKDGKMWASYVHVGEMKKM